MFILTCIITIESTAQIEAQWSVHFRRVRRRRQMWPHTGLTSASCCAPCRHAIPTARQLHHPSSSARSAGDQSGGERTERKKKKSRQIFASFVFIRFPAARLSASCQKHRAAEISCIPRLNNSDIFGIIYIRRFDHLFTSQCL